MRTFKTPDYTPCNVRPHSIRSLLRRRTGSLRRSNRGSPGREAVRVQGAGKVTSLYLDDFYYTQTCRVKNSVLLYSNEYDTNGCSSWVISLLLKLWVSDYGKVLASTNLCEQHIYSHVL